MRIALALCLLLPASGCLAARQMIHNGLSYATDSVSDDPMCEKLGESEYRQFRNEEQNVANADLARQGL